jgi:hypothetical protein
LPGVFSIDYGPQAYVRLYRFDDMDKQSVFHGRYSADEFTEELIGRLFGGGSYKALLYEPDHTGKIQIRSKRMFKVPGRYRPPQGLLPGVDGVLGQAEGGPPAPAVTPVGGAGGMIPGDPTSPGQLLNMAMISTVIDLLKSSKEIAAGRNDNPMIGVLQAQIKEQGDLIRSLLTQEKQMDPQKQFMEMLGLVKDMVAPPPPPAAPQQSATAIKDIVEGVKMLRDLSDDVNPPKNDTDPWTEALPKLLDVVGQGVKRDGVKPATRQALPAAAVTAPAFPEGTPEWFKVLAANRKKLVTAIEHGYSAETVAEYALKNIPERLGPAMREFFALGNVEELARQAIPELANYPQWATDFIVAARDLLGIDEEGDGDDDGDDAPADAPAEPV